MPSVAQIARRFSRSAGVVALVGAAPGEDLLGGISSRRPSRSGSGC